MKTCTKCGETKPLTEFYKRPDRPCGYVPSCKKCRIAAAGRWQAAQPVERNREKLRTWRHRHADRHMDGLRKAWQRHPERQRARLMVNAAIKRGDLVRPESCQECRVPCKPDAHHKDYSKPLEVEWLCRKCHVVADRRDGFGRHESRSTGLLGQRVDPDTSALLRFSGRQEEATTGQVASIPMGEARA